MEKIKQKIPWYRTRYVQEKEWLTKKSKHYIFHYFKKSLTEKNINNIIKIQEQEYKRILSTLKLKNEKIIKYYLYSSRKTKKELMGDSGNGNSIFLEIREENGIWKSKKFEVHSIYNKNIKCIGPHEDTHLLSIPWGVAIFLFCEGLSEFMCGNWGGVDIDLKAKEYMEENKLYSVTFLFSNKNWSGIDDMVAYPQAGSFIRYLINTYGLEKFIKAYKQLSRNKKFKENSDIIEKNYIISLKKLEEDWKLHLTNTC